MMIELAKAALPKIYKTWKANGMHLYRVDEGIDELFGIDHRLFLADSMIFAFPAMVSKKHGYTYFDVYRMNRVFHTEKSTTYDRFDREFGVIWKTTKRKPLVFDGFIYHNVYWYMRKFNRKIELFGVYVARGGLSPKSNLTYALEKLYNIQHEVAKRMLEQFEPVYMDRDRFSSLTRKYDEMEVRVVK